MRSDELAIAVAVMIFAAASAPSALAQDSAAEGAREFRTRCGSCHSTDADQNRVGPHLSGVLGRAAGSVEGARYSPALKGSGIVWDERTLDAYLANPRQVVPGTSMPVALSDDRRRALIVEYLRRLSDQS